MKRIFLLTIVAVATMFVATSCQKEEMGRVLTATLEQYQSDSKAYINDDNYACWEEGDTVRINDTEYTISINDDLQTATITNTEGLAGNLLAFYPASMVSGMSATGGTVEIPHLQEYRENAQGKQIINNPMAAYCPEGRDELKFRNLSALVKVTLPDMGEDVRVKSITVKGNSGQMLCGRSQLRVDAEGQPFLGGFSNGSDNVTLEDINVALDGQKSFYLVVPPYSLFRELTLSVELDQYNGGIYYRSRKTNENFGRMLDRNHIGAIAYAMDGEKTIHGGNRVILYTGNELVTPYNSDAFDATIDSNSFRNGIGTIFFDGPVTTVGDSAFNNCAMLTSINLTAGITTIGNAAFKGCTKLHSINLPTSVISIGDATFKDCIGLSSINLPAGITTIRSYTFYNCQSLSSSSITLPNGITSIRDKAFEACIGLHSISLPATIDSIGDEAFYGCSALFLVYSYSQTAPILGDQAFYSIADNPSLYVPSGCSESYSSSPWEGYFIGRISDIL